MKNSSQTLPAGCLLILLMLQSYAYRLTQSINSVGSQHQFPFLPYPKNVEMGEEQPLEIVPCHVQYRIPGDLTTHSHLLEIVEAQHQKSFACHRTYVNTLKQKQLSQSYLVEVQLNDPTLRSPLTIEQQQYSLSIRRQKTVITAKFYPGLVRALETFIQAIQCPRFSTTTCSLKNLPIEIDDGPTFGYRGLMVDTARHFLPIRILEETIDALMYNKMNVLHWHLTDQDSFPLILKSHPELAKYGSFSLEETYTMEEVKQLIHYGMVRGVRIIPEIDTPGHAGNWGNSPQNQGISCKFNAYQGGLDVTLSKTYKVVSEVFQQILKTFPDPFIHLGGDEVELHCFQNITQFKVLEGAKDNSSLSLQKVYAKKQRKMISHQNATKRAIYWARTQKQVDNVPGAEDIIQWWPKNKEDIPRTRRNVILSLKEFHYIDTGAGNPKGKSYNYGKYQTWYDYFTNPLKQVIIKNQYLLDRVLGAQLTLWSEVSNQYTHHTKIWIRGSAFAEDLWGRPKTKQAYKFLGRLTAHQRLMHRRGIPTSPATSQYCEFQPIHCDLNRNPYMSP